MTSMIEQSIRPVNGIKPLLRLRWEFHYLDGRTACGPWSMFDPKITAGMQSRSGLSHVEIKAEVQFCWVQKTLARVDASRFIKFSWVAGASVPLGLSGNSSQSISGNIIGLCVESIDEKTTVMINGDVKTERKG